MDTALRSGTAGDAKRTFEVLDPATDEVVARVPDFGEHEYRRVVDRAADALPGWRSRTAKERADVLTRIVTAATERLGALAELISRESGKPLVEAESEVRYALGFLEWAAAEGLRVRGETLPANRTEQRILVMRQSVGVTAAIAPWNFPLAMVTRKLGPALAVGCTQIVKPAPETPLAALELARIAEDMGLPRGVLNVVTGDASAFCDVVFADPRVRKVSFTGSTDVGKELIRRSAQNVTRLSLELGGHAPVLILEDADLEAAVAMTLAAKFRNGGQSCIAASRVRVARPVYERFCTALVERARDLRLGRWDTGPDIGPLINDAAVAKVRRHVEDAVAQGATLLCGGNAVRPAPGLSARFFEPTVLTDVHDGMLVCREETFGPVVTVEPFEHLRQAIDAANASPYGLAAYLAGRDPGQLLDIVERLECGVIGVNDGVPSTPQAPFGGMKLSGIGREGGHDVMAEYLETKYVSVVVSRSGPC
jgi:succinate-semialdehyde dehydrogenase/glutarate-semialdehyde dehydrogenase